MGFVFAFAWAWLGLAWVTANSHPSAFFNASFFSISFSRRERAPFPLDASFSNRYASIRAFSLCGEIFEYSQVIFFLEEGTRRNRLTKTYSRD